jgi:hypothetical protein
MENIETETKTEVVRDIAKYLSTLEAKCSMLLLEWRPGQQKSTKGQFNGFVYEFPVQQPVQDRYQTRSIQGTTCIRLELETTAREERTTRKRRFKSTPTRTTARPLCVLWQHRSVVQNAVLSNRNITPGPEAPLAPQ